MTSTWMRRPAAWLPALTLALLAAPAWGQGTPPSPTPGPGGPGAGPGPENPAARAAIAAERFNAAAGDNWPPLDKVIEGYDKVVSTLDGEPGLYTVWIRKKDGQALAQLPRNFFQQKYFLAQTVASGESFAGLQGGDVYVYWKQYDKRLALVQPNVEIRSEGDAQSKASVKRLFTDRVILDTPIVTIPPGGGPVIDLDQVLVQQAGRFFGSAAQGANTTLVTIKTAKAFPQNVEIAFEMPFAGLVGRSGGRGGDSGPGTLKTLHYSISLIPDNTGYQPRVADERVGYFVTGYSDYGKFSEDTLRTRNINRWRLEKADPALKVSPPKKPITFYIEHTTPVRYRRWVRDGILAWNPAFEKIGLVGAIEVVQQDEASGAHMEKDPEDVRYNFVRWLNNNVGTAIGPSRAHPLTGEILDADIILTDGWIRNFVRDYTERLPRIAMEGFSAETLAWLNSRPQWDPRIMLAPPAQRPFLLSERAKAGVLPFGGHAIANLSTPDAFGDDEADGLHNHSQFNGLCLAADGKSLDLGMVHMHLQTLAMLDDPKPADPPKPDAPAEEKKKDEDKEKKKDEPKKPEVPKLDNIPEEFIGPLLADVVTHEVGHTLGLRHNFKASSAYTYEQINSPEFKGKKAQTGSVMDYNPVNIRLEAVTAGKFQGDYTMVGVGPYDEWAIEYGYTFDNPKDVLKRVAEPELAFGTDEDVSGGDPLVRRYDFGKDPLAYAKNLMELAQWHRARLVDKFVKDGESWSKALKGYSMTLSFHANAVGIMANWVGGAFVNRDKKGDPNGRPPVQVVPVADQRAALAFVIENAFKDEAFGLTPALLERMAADRWFDDDNDFAGLASTDPSFPVHDRIMGIQTSVMTQLLNPTTLRRVYDNELRVPADQDVLTLPELMKTIKEAIWTECQGKAPAEAATARKPLISSLRRNLQREHLARLIDLYLPGSGDTAAYKPISDLAGMQLRELCKHIEATLSAGGEKLDPYTRAHLEECLDRIKKQLAATVIYNAADLRAPAGAGQVIYLKEEPSSK